MYIYMYIYISTCVSARVQAVEGERCIYVGDAEPTV